MKLAAAPRWAISFADLALLLLGCFVMLSALRPPVSAAPAEAAVRGAAVELGASDLFEPGEARFTPAGRERLVTLARRAAGARVWIASRGRDDAGDRLDAFELAAARAAAVARALAVDERHVAVSIDGEDGEGEEQRISIGIAR